MHPIIQANFELLKPAPHDLIKGFLASKALPDPVTPEFVAAVQEALSGLEKIVVTGEDTKALATGSPATPEELRHRFESFLSERCKGKDASKLRLVAEETGFWLIMTRLTSLFFWMFPCVNGHCRTPKRV
jgi:hypothetical protein